MQQSFVFIFLSDKNIENILNEHALAWRVISPEDPDIYLEEIGVIIDRDRFKFKVGFFKRLFGKYNRNAEVEKEYNVPNLEYLVDGEGEAGSLDELSWHGIHFMLTSTAWEGEFPLNFIAADGKMLEEFLDYALCVCKSDELLTIYKAISQIDENKLKEGFNPDKMMDLNIYPPGWDKYPEEQFLICVKNFENMKCAFKNASEKGLGMLTYFSG